VADAGFSHPRLAALYDVLDPDRSDLEPYLELAVSLGAGAVLDVGCGTGTFACLLASRGFEVIGVDPAVASIDLARRKLFADQVSWRIGEVTAAGPLQVDLVTMTANVAQVFIDDEHWLRTLSGVRDALRPGGVLAFETRVPARQAWREWNRPASHDLADIPGIGRVETWIDLLSAEGDLVSFRWTYVFSSDGAVMTSDSTLRFRSREQIETSLVAAGFELMEVRDAPDRPGREWVFIARRAARPVDNEIA